MTHPLSPFVALPGSGTGAGAPPPPGKLVSPISPFNSNDGAGACLFPTRSCAAERHREGSRGFQTTDTSPIAIRRVAASEIGRAAILPTGRWTRLVLIGFVLLAVWSFASFTSSAAQDSAGKPEMIAADTGEHPARHHEGLTPDAPRLHIGPFAITNSMLATWIVALGIIIFAQIATRRIKEIPEGAQNFWEWLVESLHDFLESIIGHALVKKTFWFFATIFIFILFTNWAGLIPGIGTIGWGTPSPRGGLLHIDRPLLRGVNADLNMTLAMALVFFACWIVWALQANGFGGFIMHLFGPKGKTTGWMKWLMVLVFICVGFLEVVSILFRPVSLSFRLYGNVFAGEKMLETMSDLVPGLAFIIPVPFYFMELLVGIVQALVFMLLTAVFTLLICQHEEGHH